MYSVSYEFAVSEGSGLPFAFYIVLPRCQLCGGIEMVNCTVREPLEKCLFSQTHKFFYRTSSVLSSFVNCENGEKGQINAENSRKMPCGSGQEVHKGEVSREIFVAIRSSYVCEFLSIRREKERQGRKHDSCFGAHRISKGFVGRFVSQIAAAMARS